GAIALILGFQTRAVGILLAVWCVLTGVVAHLGAPVDLMKNLAIAGGLVILAAASPGSIALGSVRPKRTSPAAMVSSNAMLDN
ncbi:DoxX family protein, partial [Rhizobium sp. BR 315]